MDNWHTPQENQGQIVTVSYGFHAGDLFQKVFDASDRTVSYYKATDEDEVTQALDDGWDPWGLYDCPVESWDECDAETAGERS